MVMDKRHYELVLMVHPDRDDQLGQLVEKYIDIVSKNEGITHRQENWGRQTMAYPIMNLNKSIYLLFNIECNKECLKEIKHTLKFSDSIIRFMITRVEKAYSEESIYVLNQRAEEEKSHENDSPRSTESQ